VKALLQRRDVDELRLAHALRDVPLFREVPQSELVAIWRRLSVVEAPAGTVLCRRGEPGDRCYVVQAGAVEVRLGLGPAGVSVRRAEPGDLVGEMALLSGLPRSGDLVVVHDAVLWALDRADLLSIAGQSVPLLRAINEALCYRLARMMADLEAAREGTDQEITGLRFGDYRVIAQLGAGGHAAVYSAVHTKDGTAVAIKVLPPAWGNEPDEHARLAREAEALGRIGHPHVIRVLDVGRVEARLGGGRYLVLEWLPNALDRTLRARYPDPLPAAHALRLARGVAEGLDSVHAAGYVHRDVKPSNILLRADGTPVLTDFGLVTPRAGMEKGSRLTASNVVPGTADYLAPEIIAGLPIDGRADLYALGVVLYEMLTGFVPFAGHDALTTLRAHVEESPPPLPQAVPQQARLVVDRALQKRPGDRFPSAVAMASALDEALATLAL
jgi:CRP-like cAMP-binding protein